jgi:hypothetical protein
MCTGLGIEARHINLLNFMEALYTLEEHCLAFNGCCFLKQCLPLLVLDLEMKGLPYLKKMASVIVRAHTIKYTYYKP